MKDNYAVEQGLNPSESFFGEAWTALGQRETELAAVKVADAFYRARVASGYHWQILRVRELNAGEVVWDTLDQEAARHSPSEGKA